MGDLTTVLNAIGSFGFPMVCALVMGWYIKYTSDNSREDIKEMNRLHNEEMMTFKSDMIKALNNNTLVMTRLCAKLGLDDTILTIKGDENNVDK